MQGNVGSIKMGSVSVSTTSHGGHPPEYWAARATEKIIHVAESTPAPLRMQAEAFAQNVTVVVDEYMRQAIKSDRSTVAAMLERNGYPGITDIIRKL